MADCILGIKKNGLLMEIDTLRVDADHTLYDYICNVTLSYESNGNGGYDVSIFDKQLLSGFTIGKWRITKAWITFDWVDYYAKLIMTDPDGKETEEIIALHQGGSRSESRGFYDTDTLARSIFTKAQKIVIKYPSAPICNAMMHLQKKKSDGCWTYMRNRYKEVQSNIEELINLLCYSTKHIQEYLEMYNVAKNLLKECDDPRAEQLLATISKDCKELMLSLRP